MKKWMNTLFFGSFFIAAVLIEIYSIIVLDGNLFSTISLGIVVMITGYLFIDTVRSSLKKGKEEAKFYMDKVFSEEAEKWNERYTELLNLQKASYTATKKNAAALTEQFEEVLSRLQTLEENSTKAWQRITELQKKSLEGQKNALNLEIQYNKENTKRIIHLLTEDEKTNEITEQLNRILDLLENNNSLLQSKVSFAVDNDEDYLTDELTEKETGFTEDGYGDEIDKVDTYKEDTYKDDSYTDNSSTEDSYEVINPNSEDFYQQFDTAGHTQEETEEIENAPEPDWSIEEEPEPEAEIQSDIVDDQQKVVPLYDDPNKALTADEIAQLFASFGK